MPPLEPALRGYANATEQNSDPRLYAPAFARNGDAIRQALRSVLPESGHVLEVASGSGEHIVHIARAFTHLTFQPTDRDPAALASIDAWTKQAALLNILPGLRLDAADPSWPIDRADAILCINMVHIAPWTATSGLFANAGRILPTGGVLFLYGPFDRSGVPLAASNAAFDADLRARDSAWGLRHLDSLTELAGAFTPPQVISMPANNVVVIYRRRAG
jgi:SAM-dependent methyltransferase